MDKAKWKVNFNTSVLEFKRKFNKLIDNLDELSNPDNVLDVTDWIEFDEETEEYTMSLEHVDEVNKKLVIKYNNLIYYRFDEFQFVNVDNENSCINELYLTIDEDVAMIYLYTSEYVTSDALPKINGRPSFDNNFELLPIVAINENKTLKQIYDLIPILPHNGNIRKTCILRVAGTSLPAVIRTDWLVSLSPTYSNYYSFYIKKLEKVQNEYVDTGTSTEALTFNEIVNTNASTYLVKKLRLYKHNINFTDADNEPQHINLLSNVGDSINNTTTEFEYGVNLISANNTDNVAITYFFYHDNSVDLYLADGSNETYSNVTNVSDVVTEIF